MRLAVRAQLPQVLREIIPRRHQAQSDRHHQHEISPPRPEQDRDHQDILPQRGEFAVCAGFQTPEIRPLSTAGRVRRDRPDGEVAGEDQGGLPDRQIPLIGQRGQDRKHEALVGDAVQQPPALAGGVEAPGDIAVHDVADAPDDDDGQPPVSGGRREWKPDRQRQPQRGQHVGHDDDPSECPSRFIHAVILAQPGLPRIDSRIECEPD